MGRVTARTLRRFHLAGVVVWLILGIPTVLWWKQSILWVALMSLYTILIDHLTGWGAARAEGLSSSAGGSSEGASAGPEAPAGR